MSKCRSTFRLNSLPYGLIMTILKKQDFDTAVQLLKSNKRIQMAIERKQNFNKFHIAFEKWRVEARERLQHDLMQFDLYMFIISPVYVSLELKKQHKILIDLLVKLRTIAVHLIKKLKVHCAVKFLLSSKYPLKMEEGEEKIRIINEFLKKMEHLFENDEEAVVRKILKLMKSYLKYLMFSYDELNDNVFLCSWTSCDFDYSN